MATANVTWTNNSTGSNPAPETTEVERSTQVAFDHASAMPDALASGSAGGLDPLVGSGSYADTTIDVDRHYTYRVKTVRSGGAASDTVTSLQSGYDYIYDVANDLGYPNGTPAATSAYNCSVEPIVHVDPARIPKYYYDDFEHGVAGETMLGGYNEIIRHDTIGGISAATSSVAYTPVLGLQAANGALRRMVWNNGLSNQAILFIYTQNPIELRDEITMFRVNMFAANSNFNLIDLGGKGNYADIGPNLPGQNFGAYYAAGGGYGSAGSINWSGFRHNMGAQLHSHQDSEPGQGAAGTVYKVGATMFRMKNTEAIVTAGDPVKWQIYDAGNHVYTSPDKSGDSCYHATNTGTHIGCAYWPTGYLNKPIHYEHEFFCEYLLFDEALSEADCNIVNAYLANKWGYTASTISGTLVN